MIEAAFWTSAIMIFYVYVIYPVAVCLMARVFRCEVKKNCSMPSISVIITAYNEEKDISRKLENTLSLRYPREKIEIIVASDGSTDSTNSIVEGFSQQGVKLLAEPVNRGKTFMQNLAVKYANHEILVFMDAAAICSEDTLINLISHFADDRVGVVAGRIEYTSPVTNSVTVSQGLYWRYEMKLKECESHFGQLVGVDGPLYALRRELYEPLPAHVISDLITPLLIAAKGFAVVLEPKAVAYEQATRSSTEEHTTRRRVVGRGLVGLATFPELLNPFNHPVLAWQILSHKILRWLVGFFFLIVLVSSLLLWEKPFYIAVLVGSLTLLLGGYLGASGLKGQCRICVAAYYFVLVNLAAMLGVLDFLRGRSPVSWQPLRR